MLVDETIEIQTYDGVTNTAGDFVRLDGIDSWSGLDPRTRKDGRVRYGPIWMEGPLRIVGDGALGKSSAFSLIGRVTTRADYPCRVLRVTHGDGRIDEAGVFPKSNQVQPGSVWDGRFRAEFGVCRMSPR